MSALNASARLVTPQGMAERVFWLFLIERGATMPNIAAELVDRQGRGTAILLDVLSTVSTAPPSASVALIEMKTGRPTAYFQKFLGGLP